MRPMFLAVDRKIPLVRPAKTKFEPCARSLSYSTRSRMTTACPYRRPLDCCRTMG
jgi:hypothetical protein